MGVGSHALLHHYIHKLYCITFFVLPLLLLVASPSHACIAVLWDDIKLRLRSAWRCGCIDMGTRGFEFLGSMNNVGTEELLCMCAEAIK